MNDIKCGKIWSLWSFLAEGGNGAYRSFSKKKASSHKCNARTQILPMTTQSVKPSQAFVEFKDILVYFDKK